VVPGLFGEESLDDGVLAGTGTEDEDLHPSSLRRNALASDAW
jgi:hypothetical protein